MKYILFYFFSFFLSFLRAIVCFKNMNFKFKTTHQKPFHSLPIFFFSFWRKMIFFAPGSFLLDPESTYMFQGLKKSGPGTNMAASTRGTDKGTHLVLIQLILAFYEQIKGFRLFVFVFSHMLFILLFFHLIGIYASLPW